MESHVAGFSGTLQVEKFKGGQSNPTYLLTAGDRRYVLRRKPPGKLLPSAHAVDREYRVISALAGSEVPVPKAWALCEDDSIIGTMFYIMDCVDGRIFWDPSLPGMSPAERGAIFDEMNRVIAALHSVDYAAVGLADYGKPGSYFARQIDRWSKQYRASETETIEAMDRLIDWLPRNIPPGDETYRAWRLPPRQHGVPPHRAAHAGRARLGTVYPGPSAGRLRLSLHELAPLARTVPRPGRLRPRRAGHSVRGRVRRRLLPAHRPRPDPAADWEFYMAFNMFRLAGILQGIMARALQGNASSADAVEAGRRARPLAEEAWRQVERLLAEH
jgi:aminoglycoside phosphotransferase (APT) family kinase protein